LGRLRPAALALLRAASVLGDGVELRQVAALAGVEAGELGPAAAPQDARDVLSRGPAHRAAAELLLEAGAPPESAAGHLLRVAPQADRFVVATLRLAAERAPAHGAADAAVGGLTPPLRA